jgi:CBS domain-containing protein
MSTDRVADWMSTPALTISPTTMLPEGQQLMAERGIRRLPVMVHEKLVGIVTLGDLRAAQPSAATTLSVYEWPALVQRVTVAECMTKTVVTVSYDVPILDAAQLMLAHKIGGMPVMSEQKLVGVITESDLFRLLLADRLGKQQVGESRVSLTCFHCRTQLRLSSQRAIGPDDECWHCYYHLHRCENCRYFDMVGCLLGREERFEAIPGQHCDRFASHQT